jgi:hypothetical protein
MLVRYSAYLFELGAASLYDRQFDDPPRRYDTIHIYCETGDVPSTGSREMRLSP